MEWRNGGRGVSAGDGWVGRVGVDGVGGRLEQARLPMDWTTLSCTCFNSPITDLCFSFLSLSPGQHSKDKKDILQVQAVRQAHAAQGHPVQDRKGLLVCPRYDSSRSNHGAFLYTPCCFCTPTIATRLAHETESSEKRLREDNEKTMRLNSLTHTPSPSFPPESLGKRRYDRKQSGFGGQTKPVFHKKAKTTKKIVLRLECTACKYKQQLALKRCKHFEVCPCLLGPLFSLD